MSEFIRQLGALPGAAARIWSQPFSRGTRGDILKAHLDMTFLHRKGFPGNISRLGPYRVRYGNFDSYVGVFRELFVEGEYWFKAKSEAPYILDCGANIGMAALYFKALYPRSEILCFEPSPDSYPLLEENIKENRLSGVSSRRLALAGKQGELTFWHNPGRPGALGNTLKPSSARAEVKVRAETLSSFVDRKIDFLKLDVEGAETEVVAELAASGKLGLIEQTYIEYHQHLDLEEGEDYLSLLLSTLEKAGFGYQIGADLEQPFTPRRFQGISIYAYNKAGF